MAMRPARALTGYLLPVGASRPAIVMGLIIPLVPSLFIAGVLLRSLVVPQGVRLIPMSESRCSEGMAVFTVAVATVPTVVAWTLGLNPNALPLLWLMIAALTSVVLLPQFVLSNSAWGLTTWFVTLAGVFAGVVNAPRSSMSRELLAIDRDESAATHRAHRRAVGRLRDLVPACSFLQIAIGRRPSELSRGEPEHDAGNRVARFSSAILDPVQMTGSFAAVGFTALSWGLVFVLTKDKVSLSTLPSKAWA